MFSMLVQSLYNVVDGYLSQQINEGGVDRRLAGVPVQMLLMAVAVGTGVGINSVVSRRLGAGRQEEADRAATHGIVLAVLSWLAFAVLGLCFTGTFFHAFTQNANILSMGSQYLYTVTLCSFGVFVEINMEKTLQATGNMFYPMLFQSWAR